MSRIPTGWVESTLGQVIDGFETGRSIQASSAPAQLGEFGVLKISAVTWGRFQPRQNKALLPADQPLPHEIVRAGDLLISRANTTALVGAPVLVDKDYEHLMLPDKILRVLYRPDVIDPRYLLQALRSQDARAYIEAQATGTSASMRNLSQPKLREIPIRLAPLPEQKRIADKLDTLFMRISACRARLERVQALMLKFRQAVLEVATSGELTSEWRDSRGIVEQCQSFDVDGADALYTYQFPASWQALQLSDIASIQGGITKDAKKQSQGYSELPYLRVANVQRGYFDLSDVKAIRVPQERLEGLLLKRGDILFNEGGDIDKLGRGWVWNDELPLCTHQNHVFRARLFDTCFEPRYFSWYGNSRGYNYFLARGKQTTNLASINKSVLSSLPVAVPPAEEQSEIVRRVEFLFALADDIEAKHNISSAQLESLSSALLAKAFRGELVPQDSSDEPASQMLERIATSQSNQRPMAKRPKSSRRTPLTSSHQDPLLKIVDQMPKDGFTFAELSHVASRDYESLKDELFQLLAHKRFGLKQFFDAKTKTIKFKRVRG